MGVRAHILKVEHRTTKPVPGNFLETICWEIFRNYLLGNSGGYQRLLMVVIMAQCYGITPQFQGKGTWRSVQHPGSADLSRTKRSEAREVTGSVELRDGMLNPR